MFIKQDKTSLHLIILGILAVLFFLIYSFLILDNELNRFTWPDEAANYFFIVNYINHSDFTITETLNEMAGDIIHPRSFNVYNHDLVPGSFLGMLLIYGLIGKIIGPNLILFFTPFLAVIAGLFFYKILQSIFSEQIAFLCAILFYVNPAWWYYANLAMLPNIAFISFLLIAIFLLLKIDKNIWQRNVFYVVSSAFFTGLALIIRTNEFLWISCLLLFITIIYYKKVKWYYPLVFLVVLVLVFVPIFYFNNLTYGSALSFGYLRLSQGDSVITQLPSEFKTSSASNLYNFIKFLVLPFGLSIKNIITVFNQYFINLFWWFFIPSFLGFFSLLKKYHKKEVGVFFISYFCISIYLLLYYGSWIFADQMTLQLNKIGISYVRYFLPIYIFALPFVVIFYKNLLEFFTNKKFKIILSLFIIISSLGLSLQLLYFEGHDNLLAIKNNILTYNQINNKVSTLTEENAIIISQRSDKIFFPQRKVIANWQFDDLTAWAKLLESGYPLYYYAFEGNDYLNEFGYDLGNYFNLELTDEILINEKERLYKINFIDYDPSKTD